MSIINDKRPITSISVWDGDEAKPMLYAFNVDGVLDIQPYHENGSMSHVVWFYVTKRKPASDCRINGHFVVAVNY